MMKNKQPPPQVSPIKPRKPDPSNGGREGDSTHWSGRVQETVVSALPDDILHLTIHGGADNGSFCYLEGIDHQKINYHSGKLQPDSIILEIQGQKISGNTLRDAVTWLKQVTQNGAPVMIKTVKIGLLPKDLRLYLSSRFSKGSIDHDLQQTIRDNLYMRTVPCTTRSPRPGESNGVDYTFLTLEEFQELEKSGALLESGIFDGNHYGTPKPPKEPQGALIHRSSSLGSNLTGEGKRRRNHSNAETPPKSPGPVRKEPPPAPARKKSIERAHSTNDLGPLPSNWEMAYTDDGHVYFIDHITEKTHWLDPRLAKLQKDDFLQCSEDELPFGWEKVEDPHYGTYYIDHVNRKTQYENPVVQAKKEAVSSSTLPVTNKNGDQIMRSTSESDMNGRGSPPAYHARHSKTKNIPSKRESKRVFTKNPKELKGDLFSTSLLKGPRGLGFTIIGGDHIDEEFLQIKNVVPNGPAFIDGKLKTGDVLVYVNDHCVLGYTHQDVVSLFQIIPIGDTVSLQICRGYPLPFDPDDPNTEIITTVAVSLPNDTRSSNSPASYSSRENPNMDRHNTSTKSIKSLPDLAKSASVNQDSFFNQQSGQGNFSNSDTPDVVQSKPEYFSIKIVRGENGFGFTIAHSPHGQRVKQILDKPRCKDLQEGDVLIEINNIQVHNMSHSEIVSVLKDCPVQEETTIIVQRGGIPPKVKRPVRNPMRTGEEIEGDDSLNTTQPGAYFFSAVHNETDGPPPEVPARPKTPSSSEQRPKTPIQGENRPKTPTRPNHIPTGDTWSKMQAATRPPFSDMASFRAPPHSAQLPRKEYISNEDSREYGNLDPELNNSRGSDHYNGPGNYDYNSQPPPGSRFDPFQQDLGHRSDFRGRSPYPMHNSYDKDSRFDYGRGETVRPGQFRSRTPGPEMMQRTQGFDMRPDPHRPKTPTASDMRSKTPLPGGYGPIQGGNPDFLANSRYQNSWGHNGTLRQGFDDPNRMWGSSIPEHSNSPHLPLRHDNTDTFGRSFGIGNPGAGRPPKQSTSFETEDPTPSNITRVPKRHQFQNPIFTNPLPGNLSPHTRRIIQEDNSKFHELTVRLYRQESGFGFRIIGGTEEGSQVSVGHIVPGGAADVDGQLQTGDEILYVNNMSVINSSHHRVVQLMSNASLHGHVTLVVRKRLPSSSDGFPYDIIVTRRENEGFGFVIISSVTKSGSTIGRILENSPAERCGMLHVGDRILAVNGVDISHLHHEDIVNIIKESGYSVTLTIGPPQDDTSSNTSASQRSSQGSMVNATAYPAMNDVEVRRFDRPDAPFLTSDRLHYLPPIPPPKDINRNRLPSNPQMPEEGEIYSVELQRGARGFGFSIRGGQEFNNMPLFVLRIAEGGAADLDGRLRVGDQLLEINNYTTGNMTHSEAIDIIQNGGPTVKLLVRRTGKPPPSIEPSHPQAGRFQSAQMVNGPIGQSSPYLGRRNMDRPGDQFYTYQGPKNNPNY
ncbi:hypothetical protein ACJMK2_016053 [Sinanodonta woodiana]|uniref:Uncharacterized protein n=1 Tax=Sinanodonta woodiana TaxID=1069815 RepID=A0ABD3UTC6_SINWO